MVWLEGSLAASLEPSRSAIAGAAISSIASAEAIAIAPGRRCTKRLQRSQPAARRRSGRPSRRRSRPARAPDSPSRTRRGARARARARPAATRAPAIVSSAGSSVSEASITSSTPIDAEIATP